MNKPPVIIITMGDPAGIGPEVIIKSFLNDAGLFRLCTPAVVGNYSVLSSYVRGRYRSRAGVLAVINSIDEARPGRLCVIDAGGPDRVRHGETSPLYGKASLEYVRYAVRLVMAGGMKSLVTAPVSKEAIISSGVKFAGHTEYLAGLTRSREAAMMMVSDAYKVLLVTRHIPLKEVPKKISAGLIVSQALTACVTLKKHFGITRPGIALCNFNPHSGEGGKIGDEERKLIIPAGRKLAARGFRVEGPVPAEEAFRPGSRFSGGGTLIVTYYHDQAMTPLKLLCGASLVNVTCGLPFMRVSPVHGVAFDIAGKNIADPSGMAGAIRLACKLNK